MTAGAPSSVVTHSVSTTGLTGAALHPGAKRTRAWAITAALSIGWSAYGAMETMIIPIMPLAQKKLGGTGPQIAWMLTGMFLVASVSLPLITRLAEIFDKRKVIGAALGLASIGAVMAGLAQSMPMLILGQMLQGFGMAAPSVGLGILRDTLPLDRLHRSNGVMFASGSIAAGSGLLLVGPIVGYLGYPFVYFVPVTLIAIATVMIFIVIPPLPARTKGQVDWIGALILGTGLASILIGVTLSSDHGWVSWQSLGNIIAGSIITAAFVKWESRFASPLIDLNAMGHPDVLIILGTVVCGGFTQFAMYLILPGLATMPLSSGYGMGGDAYTSSMVIFAFVCAGIPAGALAPSMSRRFGSFAVMLCSGSILIISALLLLLIGALPWVPFLTAGLCGIATSGAQLQQMNMLVDKVSGERASSASGVLWVIRAIAMTLGSQVTAAVLAAHVIETSTVITWTGYVFAISLVVAGGVVMILLSILLRSRMRGQKLAHGVVH
jgi:MFS family permease